LSGRWEILVWAAAVAAVVLGFAVWHNQRVEVNGRVSLRSWDGAVSVPQPARAMTYPRQAFYTALRQRLAALPAERARAEENHTESMRVWREKSAARDEAARILQVAERANAADLEACRERYDKAAAAAQEAFAELERRASRLERLSDPAGLLVDLPGAVDAADVRPDGAFTLSPQVGSAPVIVVLAGEADGGQAWLHPVEVQSAGRVSMDFSNENLLTMEKLRKSAGLPAGR
jgi:hypothetical protein